MQLTDESIRCTFQRCLPVVRLFVCALIALATLALLIAMGQQVFSTYHDIVLGDRRYILQDFAVLLVMLKAVRVLVAYLATHHVRMYHIVEISVIASSVELVFAPERHTFSMDVLFAVFALANLLILVMFYDTMRRMNTDQINTESGGQL